VARRLHLEPDSPLPLRARSLLAIWTATLVVLALRKLRDLPPVLVGLLLPYLALVAWHLIARKGRQAQPQPTPTDSTGISCAHPDQPVVGGPTSRDSGERLESFDPRGGESCPRGHSGITISQSQKGPGAKAGEADISPRTRPGLLGPGRPR
jgi:hypothetical protein